ncbi:glycosyltransferase [Acidisoma cellulosilyticum]|uniref:glycosyltransferase n=1 Tax=Acidisoma cellulosilyticum TaxID=2802395 RepID=UPI001D09CA93|nr:glycosyltransferase [Acidisoma cellulosilyticum]
MVLHHTHALEDCPELGALRSHQGVRLSRIDPLAVLAQAGEALGPGKSEALAAMYGRLDSPVVRSDILRAAVLFIEGGVYLDLDTITTQSLRPLLQAPFFVGCEYVVWPGAALQNRTPSLLIRQVGLDLMRKVLRSLPGGWRAFRVIQGLYFRNVNNAVMGAEAGAPLLAAYLLAMLEVPSERQALPYALGPHLLQAVIQRKPGTDLVVHPPETFSPLPPEISEHWFRIGRLGTVGAALTEETRLVHWYASIRTAASVADINPAYIQENRQRQMYSQLVYAKLGHLPQLFPSNTA